jgi:hypothetical protein
MNLITIPHVLTLNALRVKVTCLMILILLLSDSAFAQSTCPRNGDSFTVSTPDVSALSTGDLLVQGAPKMVIVDIDDLIFIPVFPAVPPFLISKGFFTKYVLLPVDYLFAADPTASQAPTTPTYELTPVGYYGEGISVLTQQQAQAYGWPQVPYKTYLVDSNANGCLSLILKSQTTNGPSYLIGFNPTTGAPYIAQKFNNIAAIFNSATVEFVTSNLNGDNRVDITVIDNGITLAVLTAQIDGTYAIDKLLSARAVWRAFGDAIKANNLSLATAYLSKDSRTLLTPSLQQSIAEMAITFNEIIDFEAVVISPEIIEIKLLVKTNNELFAYSVTLVSDSGSWKIDAF